MLPFFDKLLSSMRQWQFLVASILIGLLSIWVLFKLLTPILRPIARSVCTAVMQPVKSREAGSRVANVEGYEVKPGSITKRVNTIGKLKANNAIVVKSEIAGVISEIKCQEGQPVKEGDILFKFNDAEILAELASARAEQKLRRSEFDAITTLREKRVESAKKLNEVTAQLEIAESKVKAAEAKLEKSVIKAPFEGTVGLIEISVGAYVQVGQELTHLVDNTPMKINFKVPELYVNEIGVGQTAEIRLDGFKDRIFYGRVEAVDAQVDNQSHSIALRAATPNEEGVLRAGLFANVSLIIGEKGDALVVPETALDREGAIEFLWTVTKGKAGRQRVLTGTRENGMVEIVAGIKSGQIVVTAGQLKLGDGTPVNVVNLNKDTEHKPTAEDSNSTFKNTNKEESNESALKEDAMPLKSEKQTSDKNQSIDQSASDNSSKAKE